MIGHLSRLLASAIVALALAPITPARAQDAIQSDVAYGPVPEQKLDICLPSGGQGKTPALVMIHGGAWRAGNKREWDSICKAAAENGIAAFTVDYRLTDGSASHAWPAQLVDAQLAMRWVGANAAKYGVDPGHVCAIGDSAGGHLTLFLASLDHAVPGDHADLLPGVSPKADCAVDWFGPVDLVGASARYPGMMRNLFAGVGAGGIAAAERSASPIFSVDSHTAPTLIVQGTTDALVPLGQSEKLQQALTAAGVPNQLWIYRGGHEFEGARDHVRDFAEAAINFVKDPRTFLKENHPPSVSP